MNARRFVSTFLLLFVTSGAAEAVSVSWILGTTPPAQWTITPPQPGTSDVIQFSGPTSVYSNSCVGEKNLGGTPKISINNTTKVITLWFQGPAPTFCTLIYMPVDGLRGDFGPLAAGDWTFMSLSRDLNLEIRFTIKDKAVLHVDADAPGPLHDGTTWTKAFLTLQDALAATGSGDEIVVAEGLYKPDRGAGATLGDREATFELKDGVTVRGAFAGYGKPNPDARDIVLYKTTLSGDLGGDDLWGILNRDDNSYHVVTGPAGNPGATLDGFFVVDGNGDGPFPHHLGGGLYNPGGVLKIIDCTFQGNTAALGGGILNLGAPITMVNVQLIGNRAFLSGGGLYNWEGDATLHNCRIVGNSADRAEDMGGAAIDNLTGNLTIRDSTIADNASPKGQAITSYSWDWDAGGTVDIANSILYNGGDEIWSNSIPAVSVTYSDVKGGWTGTGNISGTPQFVAPGGRSIEGEWIDGDYRLKSTSSCIDAGSNAKIPADVLDLDRDGNTTEQLPLDLDRDTRVLGTRVDMGAYEQVKTPGPIFTGDITMCYGGHCTTLEPDPGDPGAYIGSLTLQITVNFRAKFTAQVTATSAAGGTWTGWLDPDILDMPGGTTTLWVKGKNLDLAALPAGGSVQVAQVTLYFVPAP